MLRYILHRILLMLPTALGVVLLSFFLIHLVPGDPVDILLGEQALPVDREAMRQALGLHLPLFEQLQTYFVNLFTFDFGESFHTSRPVWELVWERLPATMYLALSAIFFALLLAFPLGMWAAAHAGKWQDKTALVFSMAAFSMPSFWLGPLLMIFFSLYLGWLPVSGNEGPTSIILPAVTLGMAMSAMTARLLRASLLEVMGSDFMRTAKAKGLTGKVLMLRHALRNALLPVITVVFLQAGVLLTGAILTEAVFSWPGLGSLIVESINRRDFPVIQGCMLFIAFTYMLMTLLSDIAYAYADPRVRIGAMENKGVG